MIQIKIYSISISLCAVFVSLLINSSNAQTSENFLTYTDDDQKFFDNDVKFTIQYPENWQVRDEGYPENGGLPSSEVLFEIGDVGDSLLRDKIEKLMSVVLSGRFFMVNVEKVGSYLDTDTMTLRNNTLPGYCQALVNNINSDPSKSLIRQNDVTVAGNDGCRIESKTNDRGTYEFEVFTIVNGQFYRLVYSDHQLTVPETFPLANKMVESFQITQ